MRAASYEPHPIPSFSPLSPPIMKAAAVASVLAALAAALASPCAGMAPRGVAPALSCVPSAAPSFLEAAAGGTASEACPQGQQCCYTKEGDSRVCPYKEGECCTLDDGGFCCPAGSLCKASFSIDGATGRAVNKHTCDDLNGGKTDAKVATTLEKALEFQAAGSDDSSSGSASEDETASEEEKKIESEEKKMEDEEKKLLDGDGDEESSEEGSSEEGCGAPQHVFVIHNQNSLHRKRSTKNEDAGKKVE